MKLATPFVQLPIRFDAERLAYEIGQFTESEWNAHPLNYTGNSALRLITVNGGANDAISGEMMPTPYLQRCEYVQQVLGAFDSVWSRSRFMRLQPGAVVPPHCICRARTPDAVVFRLVTGWAVRLIAFNAVKVPSEKTLVARLPVVPMTGAPI